MIITISGLPGSGKTTVAKLIAQKLHIPYYSMGDLRGKMAQERGITIDELNVIGETDATTDTDVDFYQKKLGESGNSMVLEGRTSWYFVPHSLKVFIDVNPDIGAQRVYNARRDAGRQDEKPYQSVADAKAWIQARTQSDIRRYQTHYGFDFLDKSHYDLYLDSSHQSPQQIVAAIEKALQV